jgi:hypothetical protein
MNAKALAAHSKFFDHLVDLVPAKYYLDGAQAETVSAMSAERSPPRVVCSPPAASACG